MFLHKNDQLLMLYVLASIVFLYHQWLRWDLEKLEKTVRQGGVHSTAEYDVIWYNNCIIIYAKMWFTCKNYRIYVKLHTIESSIQKYRNKEFNFRNGIKSMPSKPEGVQFFCQTLRGAIFLQPGSGSNNNCSIVDLYYRVLIIHIFWRNAITFE